MRSTSDTDVSVQVLMRYNVLLKRYTGSDMCCHVIMGFMKQVQVSIILHDNSCQIAFYHMIKKNNNMQQKMTCINMKFSISMFPACFM